MNANELETTNKLLKVIVALLLRGKDERSLKLRERIEILDELGVKPVVIAEILGRTNTHISKELVGIRKQRKAK